MKIAILDDYQRVALRMADWSSIEKRAALTVFDRPFSSAGEAAQALAPFDALCLLRERMPMPRGLIEQLPNLKFIGVTGLRNSTLDLAAASERGIVVSHTTLRGTGHHATAELAWALLLAAARSVPQEHAAIRRGDWQRTLGLTLHGRTLGVLGLGRVGRSVAQIGQAFGMSVIAWSQNLTEEASAAAGAVRVEKDELFAKSDFVTIHLVLSNRTHGLVGARELAMMKPTAYLVNTSRGPIIDEAALVEAIRERRIAGAALDVFEVEPLPAEHPLRRLDNVIATPHLGYVTEEAYRVFYEDTVENLLRFLDGDPIRVLRASETPARRDRHG